MFAGSVISRSGQMWKLWLGGLVLLIGGIGMLLAIALIDSISHAQFACVMISSVVLCLGSLLFCCVSVRCPNCEARWMWMAISGQAHNAWLLWLMTLAQCPRCSASVSPSSDRRSCTR